MAFADQAYGVEGADHRSGSFTEAGIRRKWRWAALAVAVIFAGGVAGCVTIPVYDSKTDDLLTSLQKDTDTFIGKLSDSYDNTTASGKSCAYEANAKTYEQFRLDIGLLKTRANALYNNQVTLSALDALQDTYVKLEAAHKEADSRPDHCILPQLLTTDQQAMDSAIGGVLKLELQKKGNS